MLKTTQQINQASVPLEKYSFNLDLDHLIKKVSLSLSVYQTQKEDDLSHLFRQFFTENEAYCAGYLLYQLGIIRRLMLLKNKHFKNDEKITVDIINIGANVMDMEIIIPFLRAFPMVFFDDRYTLGKRSIFVIPRNQ